MRTTDQAPGASFLEVFLMKRLLWFVTFAAVVAAPCAATAQSTMMSSSMLGVGPHGWDYYLGTWTCSNSVPSADSGPASQTLTVSRSNAGGLFFRVTAQGFDQSGYVTYAMHTKTWWNPASYSNGSYSLETSTDTGKKNVWTGTYFNAASGKTVPIRDTYTMLSPTNFTDVTKIKLGGIWKTSYNGNCTKS
jgi:hypothetical protein